MILLLHYIKTLKINLYCFFFTAQQFFLFIYFLKSAIFQKLDDDGFKSSNKNIQSHTLLCKSIFFHISAHCVYASPTQFNFFHRFLLTGQNCRLAWMQTNFQYAAGDILSWLLCCQWTASTHLHHSHNPMHPKALLHQHNKWSHHINIFSWGQYFCFRKVVLCLSNPVIPSSCPV